MNKIEFVVEKTGTGFSAYAKDENINVGTTGASITELKANILEAFNLLNERKGEKLIKSDDIAIEF